MSKIDNQAKLRRKLLKTAIAGGGILGASHITMDKWLAPVIDSVVLPAHALTTDSTTQYSFVDPDFEILPAPGAIGAEIGMAGAMQNSASIASQIAEMLIPSAHAAVAIQAPPTRLELYLEKIEDNAYKFVLLLTAIESGLKLVVFGDGMIQSGDNTISIALCDGNPKPLSVGLEIVTEKSALVLIPGHEPFELLAAPGAVAPVKQACTTA